MSTEELVPFNHLQSKRLICKVFLRNRILYKKVFLRENYILPEDCINVKLKLVNLSSCYFPYINDIIALFLILSALVKIHSFI